MRGGVGGGGAEMKARQLERKADRYWGTDRQKDSDRYQGDRQRVCVCGGGGDKGGRVNNWLRHRR